MKALGSLEERLMEILWGEGELSVRQVLEKLQGDLAYTTVMTTMDRLYKKKLLTREREGNAFVYRPAMSKEGYHRALVESTVGELLQKSSRSVLAAFVNTAAGAGEDNLQKLEELISQYRKERGEK